MKKCLLIVKNITLLIIIVTLLTSCNQASSAKADNANKQDIVVSAITIIKNKLENYLQKNLNDPKSYEFVSLDFIDSVTYSDNIREIKSWYKNQLEMSEGIAGYKTEIKTYKLFLLAIDSVEKSLGNNTLNETAAYSLQLTFRAKNTMGGLALFHYFIQTSPKPELKLLTVTDNKDEVSYAPNDFPGFDEIYNKIIVPNMGH